MRTTIWCACLVFEKGVAKPIVDIGHFRPATDASAGQSLGAPDAEAAEAAERFSMAAVRKKPACRISFSLRWNVARDGFRAGAEKELFHLPSQILARTQVSQVESIFIHQHGLVLHPSGPGFLADVLVDALAQFAGIWREVQALAFLFQINTLHRTSHEETPVLLTTINERAAQRVRPQKMA